MAMCLLRSTYFQICILENTTHGRLLIYAKANIHQQNFHKWNIYQYFVVIKINIVVFFHSITFFHFIPLSPWLWFCLCSQFSLETLTSPLVVFVYITFTDFHRWRRKINHQRCENDLVIKLIWKRFVNNGFYDFVLEAISLCY